MQVTIKDKKDNQLLGRLEISGNISFEGITPSNVKLAEVIAKEVKSKIELVIVKNIYTQFSQQEANFSAMVYKDSESLKKTEMSTKHLRKKEEEMKKKLAAETKVKADEKAKAKVEAEAAKEQPAEEETKEEPAAKAE
jgi:ribosomal protein S24E